MIGIENMPDFLHFSAWAAIMILKRRDWIKSACKGFTLGVIALSGGVYLRLNTGWELASGRLYLNDASDALLSSLVNDLIRTTGAQVDIAVVTKDIDIHLSGLPLGQQVEIKRLFRLLNFYPVRSRIGFSNGCIDSIEHPCVFLDRLRESRLGHFRIAYRFLVSIVQLHFFKYSEAWPDDYHGLPVQIQALRAAHVS